MRSGICCRRAGGLRVRGSLANPPLPKGALHAAMERDDPRAVVFPGKKLAFAMGCTYPSAFCRQHRVLNRSTKTRVQCGMHETKYPEDTACRQTCCLRWGFFFQSSIWLSVISPAGINMKLALLYMNTRLLRQTRQPISWSMSWPGHEVCNEKIQTSSKTP